MLYFLVRVFIFLSSIFLLSQGLNQSDFENLSYREAEQKILENLLQPPYDNRIRPMDSRQNSSATVVTVNMYIRSFDFIDDVSMQYSIQLTFRQQWNDNRLKFAHYSPPDKLKYLTLSQSSPIWIPDIFFSNEKSGYFHDMIVPNLFVRIFPNGDVLYSARISLTLSCPMHLRTFPFDRQTCFIRMASYGYTTEDLIFKWKFAEPLQTTPYLDLPRFTLEQFTTEHCDSVTTTGTYPCLLMKFNMKRDSSYYNSQIFMPCAMLVMLGWLSFWIDRYEPTARMVLLIATLLVMATLIGGFNQTVPKVSYTKASDVWTVACFVFIMVALFQYIVVHYLTSCEQGNHGSVERRKRESRRRIEGAEAERAERRSLMSGQDGQGQGGQGQEAQSGNHEREQSSRRNPSLDKGPALPRFYRYFTRAWWEEQPRGQQVDLGSRLLYPLVFLIFNLVYWPQYYSRNGGNEVI